MAEIVLTIDEPTPSINAVWSGHWSHKHKLRKHWAWLVRAALLNAKVTIRPRYSRARITVERYGGRLLDADNLRAGAKPLMDCLVQEGIILDDKPAVIGEPQFHQIIGKARKTVVTIEPMVSRETNL